MEEKTSAIKQITLICMMASLLLTGCNSEASKNVKNCKKIKLGMEYEEVVEIMGNPGRVHEFEKDGQSLKRISYKGPDLASIQPSCLFDAESNQVIDFICEE